MFDGDIRDDLEKAVESLGAASSGDSGAAEPTQTQQQGDPGSGDVKALDSKEPAVQDGVETQQTTEVKDAQAAATEAKPAETKDPLAPPAQGVKAPVSWKPEVRETFAQLPAAAQQEILRREREIEGALRDTADARKFTTEMNQVLDPYRHLIAAEGGTYTTAVQSVMQSAALLRVGTPQQKAELVADMVTRFGIDLQILDGVLSAKLQGQPAAAPQVDPNIQHLQQQLGPVIEFVNNLRSKQGEFQQNQQRTMQQQIDDFFNDPANEFANDVRDDMADLLEVASRRGQQMTLQQAYERATMLHPTISQIVERRRLAASAAQQTAVAQRAAQAGASLPSGGAPQQSGNEHVGDDIRSALEAAMNRTTGRV